MFVWTPEQARALYRYLEMHAATNSFFICFLSILVRMYQCRFKRAPLRGVIWKLIGSRAFATTLVCSGDSLPTFFHSARGSERTDLAIHCRQWTWNYLQLQHGCCLDVYWKSSALNIKKVFKIIHLAENNFPGWTGLDWTTQSACSSPSFSLVPARQQTNTFREPSRF